MAITLAGMILFGGIVWTAMRVALYSAIRSEMSARITGIEHFLELESRGLDLEAIGKEAEEYSTSLPEGHVLKVIETSGRVLYSSPNSSPQRNLLWQSGRAKVREFQIEVDYAEPLDDLDQTLRTLSVVLLALAPLVTLFAGAGGFWMANRALAPVDAMTEAAGRIGITQLDARLNVPNMGKELHRLSDAFNQLLNRVQFGVQQIRRFTADAAHELRTPVAIIRSAAEISLRRPREVADYQATLRTIVDESARLSELLDQLLFLARNDSGALPLHLEPLDLSLLAATVTHSLRDLAEQRQITIIHTPAPESFVSGEPTSLRRLLIILLDNALKYSPANSIIQVQHSSTAIAHQISVIDQGPGIASADLPQLFDRFYRSEASRTSTGFGLGLSIAKIIAEAHHGSIAVASTLGQGATFTITLPRS